MKNLNPSIRTIYFYLFSAIGITLLIVGVFKLTDYTVNKIFFDTYYLPNEATRCAVPAPVMEDPNSKAKNEQHQVSCEEQLEQERKFAEISDLTSSITFIIIGSVLFAFHYRRARKLS